MRLSLITAAIATDFEDAGEATNQQVRGFSTSPQLGILSLAAILDSLGLQPNITNLDRLYYNYLHEFGSRGLGDFPAWVAPKILASGSDIYGFSSICSSYPLTIRIAECIKRERPETTILFGGPQASVVDRETLAAFPFVDFVLRGEAERSLPLFLNEWSGRRNFAAVPGLTYRSPFGVVRNASAPVIDDLDSLPLPAYHLTDDLRGATYAPLELGRGCPYACTFCSTNDFFRRKFRVKSPPHMLAEMRAIAAKYGVRQFELAHDMFTVDRRRVVDFCRHLIDSGEKFEWTCSARTDSVDEQLLELMADAGCVSVFFGVETGSSRMQRIINKDLDPDYAKLMIDTAERFGIRTTVSLIMGFPEETMADLSDSVGVYMHSLRLPRSTPQLSLLAPLAATPIHLQHKNQMVLEEIGSGMSHQGRIQNTADRDLIRSYPDIFPNFYVLHSPHLDHAFCLELMEFLRLSSARLRWLLVALHQANQGILGVFAAWRQHRIELHPQFDDHNVRYYYMQRLFFDEFTAFVRQSGPRNPAVEGLVSCYEAWIAQEAANATIQRSQPKTSGRILPSDLPIRIPQLNILELDWDIQVLLETLKGAQPAAPARAHKFYRTGEEAEDSSRLIGISPIAGRALQICDGSHSVRDFVATISESFEGTPKFQRQAARLLLRGLEKKGFIQIHHAASSIRTPALVLKN
jgi:radical SAM superfamily enzyme YgiQ (UPF0313 family)